MLARLGVTVTLSTEVDPNYDTFQEFLNAPPKDRAGFICNPEMAGILYMITNKEFVVASMASHPRNKELKKNTMITQQGNTLAFGSDPILFPVDDLNSHVLVPMVKEDAEELKLVFDPLTLTKDNCTLPSSLEFDKLFPSGKGVVLAVVPAVIVVGHGGLLPANSCDKIVAALVSDVKQTSIIGGKTQKRFATAYATLKANNFQSYLLVPEALTSVKQEHLSDGFHKSSMPNLCPNLFMGTAACRQDSVHQPFHNEHYTTIL